MDKSLPQFVSLGDSAVIIQWGNTINREINLQVNATANALRSQPFTGFIDLVPAYSSLTILYDVIAVKKHLSASDGIVHFIQQHVENIMQQVTGDIMTSKKLVEIPVCYDNQFPNDLEAMSKLSGLATDDIIRLHCKADYYVYMLGFLPGFTYMGEVHEQIALARKDKPVRVMAGAVGIAGRQTGIYPVDTPGGWQIVGHTPVKIFDAQAAIPFLINAGDTVKFVPINVEQFNALKFNQSA